MDFFGVSNNTKLENITKTILFFPNYLSLGLVNYALHQLFDLLSQPTPLLIVVNNKKQNSVVLNWVEENKIDYLKAKNQNRFFYIIEKFNPSFINRTDFEDYIFKINYKKDFGEFEFVSSDGVFSKDKIDDGTDFLIDTILNDKDLNTNNAEVIDYFSGIGVIGIILSNKIEFKKIHFIESDLISLFLLKKNLDYYQIANSVIHEMDGLKKSTIPPKSIDLIVANPPTHIKKEEFKSFLQLTKNLLKNQGKLMIVINKIIPYEHTLRDHFPNPSNLVVSQKNNYKIIAN
ncbi:MAG: methyltransferase [Promethearchaeota archaeon]